MFLLFLSALLLLSLTVADCVTICISTLSGISNYAKSSPFVLSVNEYLRAGAIARGDSVEDTNANGKLVYIPCASYAPTPSSTRSLGEQRRRARYEGKQKMLLLKDLFGLRKTCLLEIDDSKISEEVISDALDGASMVYIDGFVYYLVTYLLTYSLTYSLTH